MRPTNHWSSSKMSPRPQSTQTWTSCGPQGLSAAYSMKCPAGIRNRHSKDWESSQRVARRSRVGVICIYTNHILQSVSLYIFISYLRTKTSRLVSRPRIFVSKIYQVTPALCSSKSFRISSLLTVPVSCKYVQRSSVEPRKNNGLTFH